MSQAEDKRSCIAQLSTVVMLKQSSRPDPEVIKLFSCSTQLQVSIKFSLLITVKMLTIVGILTFMNRKNGILGLSEPEFNDIFILMSS